ncbi:MAG TPA: hypothetical protein VIW73_11600, partial [Candidatus Cybelea sp.]
MNEMHQSATPAAEFPRAERSAHRSGSPARHGVSSSSAMAEAWDEARSRELRSSPYPRLVGKTLRRASAVQVAAWDRALRDVRYVQERQLSSLL